MVNRKQTVAQLIHELGACPKRVKYFEKFGDDYELAWKRAKREDVEWLFNHIEDSIPQKYLKNFKPGAVCAGHLFTKRCLLYARNLKTALPLEVILRLARREAKAGRGGK